MIAGSKFSFQRPSHAACPRRGGAVKQNWPLLSRVDRRREMATGATASLDGMSCLVTGGTKGIGKATVEAFAAEKARVFTCSRQKEELLTVLGEWKDRGFDVQGCVCDVTDASALKEMVQKVSESFGGQLNVFVNNAGTNVRKRMMEYEDTDYDTIMNTNVRPCYELCRMLHPLLKAGRPSSVVVIGSVAGGSRAIASGCIYSMSKSSMSQLSKSLACEWAADGIRVNCVAPGLIETPPVQRLKSNDGFVAELMRETPMKRLGQPEEIASAVVFFSSSRASFVTGQTLYVDGGLLVRGFGY